MYIHTYIHVDCRHILEMESLGRKEAGRMGKGIVVVEGWGSGKTGCTISKRLRMKRSGRGEIARTKMRETKRA